MIIETIQKYTPIGPLIHVFAEIKTSWVENTKKSFTKWNGHILPPEIQDILNDEV